MLCCSWTILRVELFVNKKVAYQQQQLCSQLGTATSMYKIARFGKTVQINKDMHMGIIKVKALSYVQIGVAQ